MPWRGGILPVTEYCATWFDAHISPDSNSDVLIRLPSPVALRLSSAARMPIAVHMPVDRSMIDTPTRNSGPDGSPFSEISPATAWMIGS